MPRAPGESLVEHGLDFVVEAARSLLEHAGDERRARFAVLHLAIGAELLLKARLFRADWHLVFDKPDKATEALLDLGTFKSVSPDECLKRLETHCGVVILERTKKALDDLKAMRNRIVHFALAGDERALRSQAAKVLAGLVDFIEAELEIAAESREAALKLEMLEILRELDLFLEERQAEIEDRVIDLGDDVFSCPYCHRIALVVDETSHCLFCVQTVTAADAAEWHAENELGYSAYNAANEGCDPFGRCPHCHEKTMLFARDELNNNDRKCFSCGARFTEQELETCSACGFAFELAGASDGRICDECFASKVAAE